MNRHGSRERRLRTPTTIKPRHAILIKGGMTRKRTGLQTSKQSEGATIQEELASKRQLALPTGTGEHLALA